MRFIVSVVVAYCLLLGAFAIANALLDWLPFGKWNVALLIVIVGAAVLTLKSGGGSRSPEWKWYFAGAGITAAVIAVFVIINLIRSANGSV